MKKFLYFVGVLGILLFGPNFTGTAFAALTKQDIEEIRRIVREELQQEIRRVDERIDGLEKRIERIDERINGLEKRIDDLRGLLYVILAGMFGIVGFVIWDRRTALAPAVRKTKEIEEEEEKIKKALTEYALTEPKLAEVLNKIGIKV